MSPRVDKSRSQRDPPLTNSFFRLEVFSKEAKCKAVILKHTGRSGCFCLFCFVGFFFFGRVFLDLVFLAYLLIPSQEYVQDTKQKWDVEGRLLEQTFSDKKSSTTKRMPVKGKMSNLLESWGKKRVHKENKNTCDQVLSVLYYWWTKESPRAHVAKFYGRLRLICSVWEHQNFPC